MQNQRRTNTQINMTTPRLAFAFITLRLFLSSTPTHLLPPHLCSSVPSCLFYICLLCSLLLSFCLILLSHFWACGLDRGVSSLQEAAPFLQSSVILYHSSSLSLFPPAVTSECSKLVTAVGGIAWGEKRQTPESETVGVGAH